VQQKPSKIGGKLQKEDLPDQKIKKSKRAIKNEKI
jgi:hypothetical protein